MKEKKKIAILGAGESGVGAAVLAQAKGYNVFVSDFGEIKEKYKQVLDNQRISYEEGTHSMDKLLAVAEVVKSPGIADHLPVILELKKHGISVISEIEFAGRFTQAKTICITGSNGKTTTTKLIYHILKSAGYKVGMAGNVGRSFAMQVAENQYDYYVIELSSFQLDGMFHFKADTAILLNITPDHLDRYNNDFQQYINSKFRIIQNQDENDVFIYCADDEVVMREIAKRDIKAQKMGFSIQDTKNSAWVEENELTFKIDNQVFTISLNHLKLKGMHNQYNSLAAVIATRRHEVRKKIIRESLAKFKGVEHRLEELFKVRGINFINDSKATNVNSVWYALESMHTQVVWIVGGVDKGNDYDILKRGVYEKVKAIIALGTDNEKIHKAFGKITPVHDSNSMQDAVNQAYRLAASGDTVLLSPACASFDLFENFEDRGRKFKLAVASL